MTQDSRQEQTPSARLAALGLELPPVAPPVAAYVPAVRLGDTVWTSGQLPFVDGRLPATGQVGDGLRSAVDAEAAYGYARTAGLNALAAVADQAGGLDQVVRVVKVVVFVASAPDFTGQPGVANGASELFGEVFGSHHARSAVGVSVLPLDSPVEVEVVAEVRSSPTVVPV
ncbi:RidA family protein [Microlunatus flavus]|uniref:Enamine deaminase RidA, house cleaning of reactive enamine intermediates, YjgF/YER057c/UK114 family n=1 Tax=Microlunatus flavus TaxID=1036181 RepID=A0A1H8ZNZ7_9ACTN|nr:RidA family protein [Microlunatus flavus]SEP66074.1 Enamine deaminase RidA, house cleaning of reactive enamine intermediates, YjgF/YER057c/UK114 family [Microlunatus flavus]